MATLLKNLYSQEFIKKLSNSLKNSHKDFKIDEFKKAIFTNSWESLELKKSCTIVIISRFKSQILNVADSIFSLEY